MAEAVPVVPHVLVSWQSIEGLLGTAETVDVVAQTDSAAHVAPRCAALWRWRVSCCSDAPSQEFSWVLLYTRCMCGTLGLLCCAVPELLVARNPSILAATKLSILDPSVLERVALAVLDWADRLLDPDRDTSLSLSLIHI